MHIIYLLFSFMVLGRGGMVVEGEDGVDVCLLRDILSFIYRNLISLCQYIISSYST
jgi:hypothetical protein